jgi:glycosyltransferase involved in cell wall biosynthesis
MTNFKIKKPLLTVYMPVFNASPYLAQSIESILSQTYTNFEFIIIDDSSTDNSWQIIKKYARLDKRLRIYQNKLNLGVSLTSNIAISLARGQFLARMDADDISFSTRFEKQINFLKQNKNIVALGTQCLCIDTDSKIIGYKKFPIDHKNLSSMSFWAIPIQQPSLMVNLKKLPKNFTWYDRNKSSAEEVNLMFNFLKFGQIANLPDYLLYYRQLSTSLSHQNPKKTFYLTLKSRLLAVKNGFQPSLKAIIFNFIQIIGIIIIPSSVVNSLWNIFRGINQNESEHQIGTFVDSQV